MNKIRVIELFAGYGSQHLALKRLQRDHPDFQYEVVAFCEIDKHAIKAYRALHGTHVPNLGDITQVNPDDVPDYDLMTWSFPCTDISTAGQMKGLSENSQTRSSLCWEAVRLFRAKRPKYLVMENVKNLVSEKFQADFNALQLALQKIGYTNFWQVMNAKDYGVPQNRERVFMVSVLNCNRAYYFPQPFPLTRRLKDVLEQNVDERYYMKEEQIKSLLRFNEDRKSRGMGFQWKPKTENNVAGAVCTMAGQRQTDNYIAEPQMLGWTRNEKGEITDRHPVSVANCVTAAKRDNTQNYVMEPSIMQIGNIYDHNGQAGRIYDSNGISPTLDNIASGGNKSPKIVEPTIAAMRGRDKNNPSERGKSNENYEQRLEVGPDGTSNTLTSVAKDNLLIEPSVMQIGNLKDDSNSNFKNPQTGRVYDSEGLSPTINTCQGGQREPKITEGIRIRRLTERELYRLMDVDEKDIDTLLSAGIAKTQLTKLAGNSVVCACYYHIFRKLFIDTNADENEQLQLF